MENRISSKNITSLTNNQVFVFGSNLSGIHGGGAARQALNFGAELGNGVGMQGNTYAIPTKSLYIENTLELEFIKGYVHEFIAFAEANKDKEFLVTEIGCGLAGLTYEQVAPLFEKAAPIDNILLPESFWEVLNKLK